MVKKSIDPFWDRQTRNDLNNNFEDLYQKHKHTNDIISDLVLNSGGDSNLEVIQSRKGKKTLADRLSETDENIEKNEADITDLENNKMQKGEPISIGQINKNTGLFDETYFTEETKQQWTGNTPIGLVPADDSITKDQLANGSMTVQKTSFLRSGKNLFNIADATVGYYVSHTNGKLIASSIYLTSDWIPVKAGKSYTLSNHRKVSLYDTSKTFVSGIDGTTGRNTIIPIKDGYLRFAYATNGGNSTNIQVVEGTELLEYEPFKIQSDILELNANQFDQIKNEVYPISADETDFIQKGKNLFNKNARTISGLLNTAEIVPSSQYDVTDYIPVKAGKQYIISRGRNRLLYDSNKENPIYTNHTNYDNQVFTPGRDGYLRVNIFKEDVPSLQIQEGAVLTEYEPYRISVAGVELNADIESESKIKLEIIDEDVSISSDLFTVKCGITKDYNGLFNFKETLLGGTQIHRTPDDIAPIRTFYTVGANHGYFKVDITNNGKTNADIGSVWSDGTDNFILIGVGDGLIELLPDYKTNLDDTVEPTTLSLPKASLTHVSGATNTSTIPLTGAKSGQLYPSVNKHNHEYFADGNKVVGGKYHVDNFKVVESYNIIDYKHLIDSIKNKINYKTNIDFFEGVVKVNMVYDFKESVDCTVYMTIKTLKKTILNNTQFLQSNKLELVGHNLFGYIPNSKVNNGYDMSKYTDITNLTARLVYTDNYLTDPAIPVNRIVEWLQNGIDKKVGFVTGYIFDKGNGKHAKRLADNTSYLDLRENGKVYPIMFGATIADIGQFYSGIGYRNYMLPTEATNQTYVEVGNVVYVYIEYHKTVKSKSYKLNKFIGRDVEVLEKSSGFTLINYFVGSEGIVFDVSSYGYAVLKLK